MGLGAKLSENRGSSEEEFCPDNSIHLSTILPAPTPPRPIRETIQREALCLWPASGRIFKPVSKAGRECVFLS